MGPGGTVTPRELPPRRAYAMPAEMRCNTLTGALSAPPARGARRPALLKSAAEAKVTAIKNFQES